MTGGRVVLQRVRTVVRLLHQHRGLKSLFFVRPAGCGERGITPNCGRDGGLEGHVEVSGWTTHRSPRVPPTFPRQPNRKGGRGEGDAASPAIKHCRRMMDTRNEITGLEIRGKGRRCQIVKGEGNCLSAGRCVVLSKHFRHPHQSRAGVAPYSPVRSTPLPPPSFRLLVYTAYGGHIAVGGGLQSRKKRGGDGPIIEAEGRAQTSRLSGYELL